MAEFIGSRQERMRKEDAELKSGFDAMGHPVPAFRKQAAYEHCKSMGLTDAASATGLVDRMAQAIERDEPYVAMEAGMAHLDLTGTYRVMAVLMTALQP